MPQFESKELHSQMELRDVSEKTWEISQTSPGRRLQYISPETSLRFENQPSLRCLWDAPWDVSEMHLRCIHAGWVINDGQNRKLLQEPDQIYNTNDKDYWWDTPITTATKIKYNKSDLVMWNKDIIKFSYPTDINISKKIAERLITTVRWYEIFR